MTGRARLARLAVALDRFGSADHFDMRTWRWCAIGWATRDSILGDEGLRLVDDPFGPPTDRVQPEYRGHLGRLAVQVFFGLEVLEVENLFGYGGPQYVEDGPAVIADRIRAHLYKIPLR
jgi:hypothetical protein